MTRAVYLDHNAGAPARPAVAEAVAAALTRGGNPSSVHGAGRAARRTVEDARESVAALLGAAPGHVVFTSGGTEANNLALAAAGDGRIVAGATEHDSVLRAAAGADLAPVGPDGVLDLAAFEALLDREPAPGLVSIMLANNETGVIHPVTAAARLAHARRALVHCDAVQGAGRLVLDLNALGVDLLTLSAHKLGGPQGMGALVMAGDHDLAPVILGGGQERGRRAGTEAVPAIAGFGVAADLARADAGDHAHLAGLRDRMEAALLALAPGAHVFGAGAARLPNTSCISMPGVPSETQVMALDLAGVAVSAGAACSSGKIQPSHVLRAMGVRAAEAATAIRISLGWDTAAADVDRLVEAWQQLYTRAGARHAA